MRSERGLTIGIFGAGGFLGSHLVQALLLAGHRVVGFSRTDSAPTLRTPDSYSDHFLRVEWRSAEALANAALWAPRLDVFFHLAANINVGDSLHAPEAFVSGNLELTSNSIATQRSHWKRSPSVFISSDRVFGQFQGTADESARPEPVDPYGLSKWLSEEMVRFFAKSDAIGCSVVRTGNLYGPYQRSKQFVPSLFRRLRHGETTIQVGNLNVRRNYLEISDLIDGLVRMLKHLDTLPSHLHFAGREMALEDVATEFTTLARSRGFPHVEVLGDFTQARPIGNELSNFEFNGQKTENFLDWSPKVTMHQGLLRIFKEEVS